MVQSQTPTTHVPPAQIGRRILRASGALMFIQVILRGFGIIEKMIMAHYFGTDDPRVNAYSAARRIAAPVLMLGEQVVMHSFLPPFVQRMREKGEKEAWRMASTTINIMAILMALIAVVGIFFTKYLLHLYLQGWIDDQPALVPLTIRLTQVMVAAMIFLAISSLTYCLLNSYKQFALPASSDLALKATVLVFAILFAKSWGAYALAIGFVVGAAAKVFVQSVGLGRRVTHYRPVIDLKDPSLKQFALLALPLIAGWAFSTFRGLVETRVLSSLESAAGFSSLDYAKTICDIPVTFFPYVFGIALFPFLADIAAAGDKEKLREMLLSATRMMILIFVPLAAAIIVFRFPILMGLYGGNKFTAASAHLTSGPLLIYALAMLAAALEIIVNQFYFAMSDTIRPTVVGMVLVPVHIAVAYFGGITFGLGAVGVALAFLIYRSGKVIVLYTLIRQKIGKLKGSHLLALLGKMAVALLPLIGVCLLALLVLPTPGNAEGKIRKMLALLPFVMTGGLGMVLYLGMLHVMKVDEVALMTAKVRAKLGRKPTASA